MYYKIILGTPYVKVQQLLATSLILIQQELREKHMLFEKENLTLSKIIGQGKQYHSSVINF